jgi:1,4-alpha-glucan branching enzyme
MNPQTIVNRANSEHFGHDAAHADHQSNHQKTPAETKSKKGVKAAPRNKAADTEVPRQHVAPQETTFRLDAPSAQEVRLAGSFTEWDKKPVKMLKGGGGVWHAKLSLPPGRHLYRFIVDGVWQDDPSRTERASNPYGTSDTVLVIS